MSKPWRPPEQRGRDWDDAPRQRDDTEPLYPDGTPRYECWNTAPLKKPRPDTKRVQSGAQDTQETQDEED